MEKQYVLVELGTMEKGAAERLAAKLNGKTYMDFEVQICPFQGELHVNVQCQHDDVTEATAMVVGVLAHEASRIDHPSTRQERRTARLAIEEEQPSLPCWMCDAPADLALSDLSDPKLSYHFCSTECRIEFEGDNAEAERME